MRRSVGQHNRAARVHLFALSIALLVIPIQLRCLQSRFPDGSQNSNAETELQIGTQLTRSGHFQKAIPHLLAAQGGVSNQYAAEFNLALCYVATRQSTQAIPILTELRRNHESAQIENLLAQAYVGVGDSKAALDALKRAAAITPDNEKLYAFVADACTEAQNYELGLDVVDVGLQHLPNSAALHYQRAMFLSSLDEFDAAKPDFELARKLGAGSDIGYLALAQQNLLAGKVEEAVRSAREAIGAGHEDYRLLTILGEGLLRSGITPAQPQFAEAKSALSNAVKLRPSYSDAQLALGKLELISHHVNEAISHLEQARSLAPHNPAVYSQLAAAYREHGDAQKAEETLAVLAQLNREQVEKISSAPGERKPVAGASNANRRGTPKNQYRSR
ncbi:MAG TPA: tetratricopeptide repeat protein [Terriglobales bacterium]|nr:tetratricopeptide repeat protein [Terriglobales bacterium]